jgi:hypothetical protein
MGFIHWIWLVVKKWVWLIALLPATLELLSTYIPWFPQVRLSWQWSVGIGLVGLLISAYLVHRDVKAALAIYQDHEPKYDLSVLELETKNCAPEQAHIECTVRIVNTTLWLGQIEQISLANGKLPTGLSGGIISSQSYQPIGWHCYNMLKLPYLIPQNGVDIQLEIHYSVGKSLDVRFRKSWERMQISINFLVGYETQPVGYIQKSVLLQIPVNLGKVFDELSTIKTENVE